MGLYEVSSYQELEQMAKEWKGEVCLFGAGLIGKTWGYDVIQKAGFHIDYYCDNNVPQGQIIRNNIQCIGPENIFNKEILVFITVGKKYQKDIINELLENGINKMVVVDYFFMQVMIESIINSKDSQAKERYKCIIDDEEYIKNLFLYKVGYPLNIENPKTFNEKIQWLKFYNRKPEYTMMVDKYEVREYIQNMIGEKYLIPLVGGPYANVNEIEWDKLPNQFVLKCNHDSGSVIICKDKSKFDFVAAEEKLAYALKYNFWYSGREWPYKDVKRKIIAEKYMTELSEVIDYKFMCFNGKVKIIFTCTERYSGGQLKVTFFDTEWNRMPFERHYPSSNKVIAKPLNLNLMIILAEKLCKNIPFVRVDFYEINNKVYFGEMTFFPGGGMEEFTPQKWDGILGEWIELPKK